MRNGKPKVTTPAPVAPPKPQRDYSQYIRLFAIGDEYKPGTEVLVHPDKLEAALEKARQNGYRLRGQGYDSDKLQQAAPTVVPPLPDGHFKRPGNPGKKVVEVASKQVFESSQAAADHFGISRVTVYNACNSGRAVSGGHRFRYATGQVS